MAEPAAEGTQADVAALPPVPQARGTPVLARFRHVYGFMYNLLPMITELERANGPIFRAQSFLFNTVLALGPDAAERVLMNRDGAFSSEVGWWPFIGRVFPGAIMAMDGKEHLYHRRIMQGAFGREALAGYLDQMNPIIDGGMTGWLDRDAQRGRIRFYPRIKQLALDIAATAFMGIELGREADRLNRAFVDAVEASMAYIRWPIPPFGMWRGVRGRRMLVGKFEALLPEKRAAETADLFSRLCHARSEEGETYSDAEVIDHMIFVMMAAHDTSTSTMTTMAYLLAKHPEWQERLREEARSLGKAQLDYDDLNELPELTWVAKEALRLYPPLTSMPRVAVHDAELCGYRIPKGQLVGVAPIFNHHDPDIWREPERFDPERFAPERAEDRQHRFAWIPFGGGAHKCIGQHFGLMEIRAAMFQLLLTYRWRVPEGYEMPYQMVPIAKPRDGLPLELERLG